MKTGKKVRLTRKEKEKLVIELYEQGYTYREIAKILRISVRDISRILRREERKDEIDEIKERLNKLEEVVKKIEEGIKKLGDFSDLVLIKVSALRRVDKYPCIHIDEDGYCKGWFWRKKILGLDMKEEDSKYYINVRKHPLICVACPKYEHEEEEY